MPDDRETHLSERDHAMAEAIARRTSEHVLDAVRSREFSDEVVTTWADSFHRIVGRAVVRLVIYIAGVALLIGAIKAGVIDRVVDGMTLRGK